mgnify:CR=1 FL=1
MKVVKIFSPPHQQYGYLLYCKYVFDFDEVYFEKSLNKKDNYDRYSFDGVVEWWKNKASKRYESLKADGRIRTELETWNCADDIDIIR